MIRGSATSSHQKIAKRFVQEIITAREPGLPDGLFSNQRSQTCVNFGGQCTSKCLYIYCMAIWNILQT
jgi:hypothetical protein